MQTILQKATWKKALLGTLFFAAMFVLINASAWGVAGLLRITGGHTILDFARGYSADKAYAMLTALGEAGRAFYRTRILPIDFVFPLSYMLCYAGWTALLLKHVAPKGRAAWLLAVPVLAMACDWAENIGILAMLRGYPALPPWAVTAGSVFGVLKFGFIVASVAVIAVLLVLFLWRKRKAGTP